MQTLGKLFGSDNKVRIMRLFLLNPELTLNTREVAERSRLRQPLALRELKMLETVGLLSAKKRGQGRLWQLDPAFPFILPLKMILKSDLLGRKKQLIKQFSRCGKISLLIISGVFLEDSDSRADLLVVGSNLKKNSIARVIKELEAEVGKELSYAVMETPDFQYRLNAWDKFVRDIIDYPHSVIIDKLGLGAMPSFFSGLSTVR